MADGSTTNQHLAEYERHFNLIQAGLRGLASTWTLGGFAGIAFFLNPEVAPDATYVFSILGLSPDAYVAVTLLSTVAFGGLLALWVLDQLVYHRLLLSAFLAGLRLELTDPSLPQTRWVMASSDQGRSIPDYVQKFYALPMVVFTSLSFALVGMLLTSQTSHWIPCLIASGLVLLQVFGFCWMVRHQKEARLAHFAGQLKDGTLAIPPSLADFFDCMDATHRNVKAADEIRRRLLTVTIP